MIPRDDNQSISANAGVLRLLTVLVTLALGWILLPFYGTIMWGVIIALMFSPLYRRLLPHLRRRRTLAAVLTLLLVLVMAIIPLVLLSAAMAREAVQFYEQIQSGDVNPGHYFRSVLDALPAWVTAWLERFGLVDLDSMQARLSKVLAQGSQFIATQALNIGQDTFQFVASIFIALYLAFFLIRDGESISRALQRAIPLAPSHKQELLQKFATVIRATVKGNLLVALIQGSLGGLAFWFLGIKGAVLWAVVMAFMSLLPAIGAGLVWAPVAIYLLVTGEIWQGVALVAYGVLVIGLVDNLLRPVLVGKDTRMPDYVVMISTLGGMTVFGINGFVLGPTIAAMFIAVWQLYGESRDEAG